VKWANDEICAVVEISIEPLIQPLFMVSLKLIESRLIVDVLT